jgi:nicotinamide mononucleotide transporter
MSTIEVLGFLTGLVSVWLFARQNVWAWPTGIANSGFWLVLFWQSRLFLDAGLQVVYIALSVWGWYWWLRGGRSDPSPSRVLRVARTQVREMVVLVAVGIAGTAGLWWAMTTQQDAMPFWDAATTVVSLIAQYMMTRKLIGNWWCWIAVDLAYVVMYSVQQLYLTAALQPVFIAICVSGWRSWQRELNLTPPTPTEVAIVQVAS